MQQLKLMLDVGKADKEFLAGIKYLIGECNYGGRVTDEKDRRVLSGLVDDFFHLDLLKDDFKF